MNIQLLSSLMKSFIGDICWIRCDIATKHNNYSVKVNYEVVVDSLLD